VTPQDPTRGVLDFPRALQAFQLERRPPAPVLAPWIENYWEVKWDLPPGVVHRQNNLSHAAFNVVVEAEGSWLYGVPGPTFTREISGTGRVFGIKFHPGAFFPWTKRSLAAYFDTRIPLAQALGEVWLTWAGNVKDEPDFFRRADLTDAFLDRRKPALPGEGRRCARRLIEDRNLIRVEEASRVLGYDVRGVQRIFRREVGIGPKDVLRRYRLMEAAERLAREPDVPGIELAASLGYADQAHFIRDFKAVTGVPPEMYRRRQ